MADEALFFSSSDFSKFSFEGRALRLAHIVDHSKSKLPAAKALLEVLKESNAVPKVRILAEMLGESR